jgi:hypothetical protein
MIMIMTNHPFLRVETSHRLDSDGSGRGARGGTGEATTLWLGMTAASAGAGATEASEEGGASGPSNLNPRVEIGVAE